MPDPDATPASPTPASRKPREWDKHARPAPPSRSGQLLTALFLIAAIAGLIVWFLWQPKQKPDPFLYSVAVEKFTDPRWPTAAGVSEDSQRLAALPLAGSDTNTREGGAIRKLLKSLADKPPAEGPLILHVAGLAAVRNDTVYLVPSNGRPNDPAPAADPDAHWTPIADLLDAIDRNPTANKFLLLDIARPVGDPFSGQLRDDAAAVLDRLLTGRKPKYPVLVSCGPGQFSRPTAAPEKGSAFGMYLADGLHGRADGADDNVRDDRVTVRELAAFTRNRVARYVRSVWGEIQVPRLHEPTAAGWDFPLTNKPLESTKAHDPVAEPSGYPDLLVARWAFLDGLQSKQGDRSNPWLFAQLVGETLRAESRWLATGDVEYAVREVPPPDTKWKPGQLPLAAGVGPADWQNKVGGLRLAARPAAKTATPPDWKPALFAYVTEIKVLRLKEQPTPAERDKCDAARGEWVTKTNSNPEAAAALVWQQASGRPQLSREDVGAYATAMSDVWGDRPDPLELLYLKALARLNFTHDKGLPDHPGAAVAAALAAENQLGVALAVGPDGFAAVKDRLTTADKARQEAMRLLFKGVTDAEMTRATVLFRQAADVFAEAGRSASEALVADRSAVESLGLLVDAMPAALADRAAFENWLAVAREAKPLANGTMTPTGQDRLADGLRRLTDPFKKATVQDRLDKEKQRKEPRPWADPAKDFAPFLRLVAGPTLPAEQRRAVWDLVRKKRRELHNMAREADDKDDEQKQPTPKPDAADLPPDPMSRPRAEAALALLELTGSPGAAKARSAVEAFLFRTDGPQAEAAGTALATAWNGIRSGRVIPPEVAANPTAGPPTAVGPAAGRPATDEYLKWVVHQLNDYQPLRVVDTDNKFFGRLLNLNPN